MPSKVSPQAQCFERADETGQQFIVAKQYTYDASGKAVYSYESYNNVDRFLKHYSTIAPKERTYFELIRENRPCLEYYDIEWVLNEDVTIAVQEQVLLEELVRQRNSFDSAHAINPAHLRVTSASSLEKKKGSMHVVVFGGFAFHNNNVDMMAFMKAFHTHIQDTDTASHPVLDKIKLKNAIDWNVYTRNRIMRCLGSIKCKDPERPLVEAQWHQPSVDAAPNEFYITNINVRDAKFRFIDIRQITQIPKQHTTTAANRTRAIPRSIKTTFNLQDQILVDSIQRSAMDVFRSSKKSKSMVGQFEVSGVEPADFGGVRITLRRVKAGPCVLCNRAHDSDNAFLETNAVASVSFSCRRQPGKYQEVGKMPYSTRIAQRDLLIQKRGIDFPADEEYSEKFMRYCDKPKSLIIRSPTGSGKTRFLKNFVLRNPHLTYIAVSCRRTLADELAKLPGFESYRDISGELISGERVVVQAESVWRLDPQYYEDRASRLVFIMDEFCSLVHQFISFKTMGKHHQASVAMFGMLQREANRVIALDADFTATEVELLKERRNDLYIVHNKHVVHDNASMIFHETEETLLARVLRGLTEGKKMWIVSTHSAIHTESIHKYLEQNGIIGTCMTSNTVDADKRTIIRDIKSILDQNTYFIHTPTISVGIDYNIPDVVDCVVGFFNTQTEVTVEICRQMLRRARHVKEETYWVHMNDKFNNLPETTEGVANWLCSMDYMIRSGPSSLPLASAPRYTPSHVPYDNGDGFRFKLQDTYYSKIFLHSQTQVNKSMNDFLGRFVQQMKDTGCSVIGAGVDDGTTSHLADVHEHEVDIASEINRKIAAAPVVDLFQYEELVNRRGKASATPHDEFVIRRHYLTHVYNIGQDYEITEEWVSNYNSEKEIAVYKNFCLLRSGVQHGLADARSLERDNLDYIDKDNNLITRSIHRRAESPYVRLQVACDMLKACGFEGPFSEKSICGKDIKDGLERGWSTIADSITVICTTLKIRKPTYKAWTFKNKLYFINSVLNAVFAVKVTSQDSHSATYKIEHLSNVGKKKEIELANIPWTIAS